jgi:hypothetical protein
MRDDFRARLSFPLVSTTNQLAFLSAERCPINTVLQAQRVAREVPNTQSGFYRLAQRQEQRLSQLSKQLQRLGSGPVHLAGFAAALGAGKAPVGLKIEKAHGCGEDSPPPRVPGVA